MTLSDIGEYEGRPANRKLWIGERSRDTLPPGDAHSVQGIPVVQRHPVIPVELQLWRHIHEDLFTPATCSWQFGTLSFCWLLWWSVKILTHPLALATTGQQKQWKKWGDSLLQRIFSKNMSFLPNHWKCQMLRPAHLLTNYGTMSFSCH